MRINSGRTELSTVNTTDASTHSLSALWAVAPLQIFLAFSISHTAAEEEQVSLRNTIHLLYPCIQLIDH